MSRADLEKRPRCKECGIPFSDWFCWPGLGKTDARFCYPCWADSDYQVVRTADGGVYRD